jgi:hypothetical protein
VPQWWEGESAQSQKQGLHGGKVRVHNRKSRGCLPAHRRHSQEEGVGPCVLHSTAPHLTAAVTSCTVPRLYTRTCGPPARCPAAGAVSVVSTVAAPPERVDRTERPPSTDLDRGPGPRASEEVDGVWPRPDPPPSYRRPLPRRDTAAWYRGVCSGKPAGVREGLAVRGVVPSPPAASRDHVPGHGRSHVQVQKEGGAQSVGVQLPQT